MLDTHPYVRNSRIRFLKQSLCCPCKDTLAPQSTGLPWSGFVSSKSLPCFLPADALLDGAFPPVGRLGLTSPPSSVLCAATTALCPSQGASLVARLPDTLPASIVRGLPTGTRDEEEAPSHARAFGRPVPQSGNVVKETGGSPKFPSSPSEDMPRSQTPVVSYALAITYPGLLPSGACKPSAFLSRNPERYPRVHDYTHFGAQSRGLPSRYTRLRTAPCGEARGCATDLLARRSSGRT